MKSEQAKSKKNPDTDIEEVSIMQNAGALREEIISRLKHRGLSGRHQGSIFALRYKSQEPGERQSFRWNELLDELTLSSIRYGIDGVLEAAYIEERI